MDALGVEESKNILTKLTVECICPVCLNSLHSPVSVCPTGHAICGRCRPKLKNCPLCQKVFPPPTVNTLLNSIVELLPRHCKFEGCEDFITPGNTHEKWCGFAEVSCNQCNKWTGQGKNLLNHFSKEHSGNFRENDLSWNDLKLSTYFLAVKVQENFFLIDIKKDDVGNCVTVTYSHVPNGKKITDIVKLSMVIGDEKKSHYSSTICLTPENWINKTNNLMIFAIPSLKNVMYKDKLSYNFIVNNVLSET